MDKIVLMADSWMKKEENVIKNNSFTIFVIV